MVVRKGTYISVSKLVFSGIAHSCSESSIRLCALGSFRLNGSWGNRIAHELESNSALGKNISIDSVKGVDDLNGKDGTTIESSKFNQRYFEVTLGWDFEAVWKWDVKNNRPALRSVGVGAAAQLEKAESQKTAAVDMLTQQMRDNIWL